MQLGHEREAAICLMQKYIDQELQNQPLLIKSAIALDHLKGYLYIESEKEAYVRLVSHSFWRLLNQLTSYWGFQIHGISSTCDSNIASTVQYIHTESENRRDLGATAVAIMIATIISIFSIYFCNWRPVSSD